ncbi:autotransporter domain-containing protein [Methylobacterium goesingense]|uniref:Autotransporter domain-containing protein n=1 Tax=Methylobacterium goesingense TaxID=243690 RepID=A0ABV2LD18_9HYPH|nr:autotransporter domain-containing protein [Methylobacterium goesingense]GJD74095.1 hypothetical protein CFIICLFH_2328 [Methylobacterium goesingense]
MSHVKLVLLAATALVSAEPAFAQSLFSGVLPSADVPVAPQYPAAVPNSGQPLPDIRAVTGFDRTFGYGSSSTNTRRADRNINQNTPGNTAVFTEVNTNGHANYIELFSPLIGAANGRGSSFPPATNFADGGSNSVTALTGSATLRPQVADFQRIYGRYSPGDIVVQWSGINDWNVSGIRTQAQVDQIRNTNVTFQTEMVRQNLALGARNYVFIGLSDLGTFRNFTDAARNNDPALLSQGSLGTNAGMLPNLVALQQQTGANIHYFDQDLLVREIRANPTAYGFAANGALPNVDCIQASGGATQCASRPFNEQNRYMSLDGLHWTYQFHNIQAQAIANQLIAPYTIAPQGEIADVSARAFGNSLLLRLDAYRAQNTPALVPAAYTADLPGRAAPPVPMAVLLGNPVSLFAEGGYANGSRERRVGAPGFDYEAPSVTVGAEYRARPDLLLGAAFNYSNASTNLTSLGALGATRIDVDTYQFAGFASLNRPDWFADLVVGYGFNDLAVSRAGLLDRLSATPRAETLLVAAKAAYLFDLGAVRVGPVGTLTYAHTWIDAYREQGDPLLTQAVGRQARDGLTGGAGLQIRLPVALGERVLSPFVNLTAEHDFLGQLRTITTAQTYALTLPIATAIRGYDGGTYGKVAAGLSIDLGGGLSGMINGAATFARANGDDFAVNGGLRYRF